MELRPRVGPILQSLVRRELIAPDHSALVGEDAFGFHHLLIQEAAYRQAPKELRADLHLVSRAGSSGPPAIGSERTRRSSPITSSRPPDTAWSSANPMMRRTSLIDRASATPRLGRPAGVSRGATCLRRRTCSGARYDLLPPGDQRRLAMVPEFGQVADGDR